MICTNGGTLYTLFYKNFFYKDSRKILSLKKCLIQKIPDPLPPPIIALHAYTKKISFNKKSILDFQKTWEEIFSIRTDSNWHNWIKKVCSFFTHIEEFLSVSWNLTLFIFKNFFCTAGVLMIKIPLLTQSVSTWLRGYSKITSLA